MKPRDRTEEELAELLAELPPAPEAWVQAARAIGRGPDAAREAEPAPERTRVRAPRE